MKRYFLYSTLVLMLSFLAATAMAEQCKLPGTSAPWPVSAWVPWAQCNAAEFAAAGVGVA